MQKLLLGKEAQSGAPTIPFNDIAVTFEATLFAGVADFVFARWRA